MNITDNALITTKPAQKDDFDAIMQLCEIRFGKGYLNRDEFDGWLAFPEFFKKAEYKGVFAGFAFLMPEDTASLAAFMKLDKGEVEAFAENKPVIHCRSAALLPEFEHCGVMNRLLSDELETAKKLGFGAAFAPTWKYNDFIPMERLMNRLGFERMCDRSLLWYGQDDYSCIACGGRCRCDAVIFRKKL